MPSNYVFALTMPLVRADAFLAVRISPARSTIQKTGLRACYGSVETEDAVGVSALRQKQTFVIAAPADFKVSLLGYRSERRQFDRGMHNAVSEGQSPRSDIFGDGRPGEMPSIPVE